MSLNKSCTECVRNMSNKLKEGVVTSCMGCYDESEDCDCVVRTVHEYCTQRLKNIRHQIRQLEFEEEMLKEESGYYNK